MAGKRISVEQKAKRKERKASNSKKTVDKLNKVLKNHYKFPSAIDISADDYVAFFEACGYKVSKWTVNSIFCRGEKDPGKRNVSGKFKAYLREISLATDGMRDLPEVEFKSFKTIKPAEPAQPDVPEVEEVALGDEATGSRDALAIAVKGKVASDDLKKSGKKSGHLAQETWSGQGKTKQVLVKCYFTQKISESVLASFITWCGFVGLEMNVIEEMRSSQLNDNLREYATFSVESGTGKCVEDVIRKCGPDINEFRIAVLRYYKANKCVQGGTDN